MRRRSPASRCPHCLPFLGPIAENLANPEILLKQASASLDTDPRQAAALANGIEHSGDAWFVYGKASGQQKDKEGFFAAYQQIDVSRRKQLHELCPAAAVVAR